MADRRVQTKRLTRAQRSDLFCAIYLSQGAGRSIKGLSEFCEIVGVAAPSVHTLERYSTDFDWVARARAFDAREIEADESFTTEVFRVAMSMDASHARVGQVLQAKGTASLAAIPDDAVPASAAVRMMHDGVMLERLAGGRATDRTTISMEISARIWQIFGVVTDRADVPADARSEMRRAFRLSLVSAVTANEIGGAVPDYLRDDPKGELTDQEVAIGSIAIEAHRRGMPMPDFSDVPPLPPPGQYGPEAFTP